MICVSSLPCFGMDPLDFGSDTNEDTSYTRSFENDVLDDVQQAVSAVFPELFDVRCWYTNIDNSVTIRLAPKRLCSNVATLYKNNKEEFFEYFKGGIHSGDIQFVRIQFGEFVLKEEEIISRSDDSEISTSESES